MNFKPLADEEILEEYRHKAVELVLTDRRLIAETPSTALFGLRSKSTAVFLEDLDAVEIDLHGHRVLAWLGILVVLMGWLSQDAREPLVLIGLALVAAYFMTRRMGVEFNAGGTRIFVEAAEGDGLGEELEAFVHAVEQARAARSGARRTAS